MPIQFQHHTLPNGLTVLGECNADAHTAAVGFFVNTGARDEDAPQMGVSHFLEHMMFKGTDRRTADDVNREFDEIGANYNAYTSHENTAFFAQVLPEHLPRAIDLLGDILRPALRDDDFEIEKNVILEEIGMYEDRPQWRLQDALLERYFADHPLGYRVLGTTDTIRQLDASSMRQYFQHRYSPDNMVVALSGRVDFEAVIKDLQRLAGDWPATGAQRDPATPAIAALDQTIRDAKLSRHYLAALSPAPGAQDAQRYAARVLADVLGDTEGSRIYWALVDPGLAEEADLEFIPMDRAGAYMIYASCDPDEADAVEAKLWATIDALASKKDLDEAEVERAKNKLATEVMLRGESTMGRMTELGTHWLYQHEYTPLDEELRRIEAVTLDDLRQLLTDYPFQPRGVLRLTP
ncbi:MAG: M16 family metallopeptidase [Phycisphaeraceae bacterium]